MDNEITSALFDAYDIRNTIKTHGLCDIKRVHEGADNEDTLKDLIDNVVCSLEQLEAKILEKGE